MTADTYVSQPWDHLGVTQDEFKVHIDRAKARGERLVTQTFTEAYPEDEEGTWVVQSTRLDDVETGEHIVSYSDDEADTDRHYVGVFVVECCIKNI